MTTDYRHSHASLSSADPLANWIGVIYREGLRKYPWKPLTRRPDYLRLLAWHTGFAMLPNTLEYRNQPCGVL